MNCAICKASSFIKRRGIVRDAPSFKIYECENCGLVSLSSKKHIKTGFYEDSHMHGSDDSCIESRLKENETDDLRRFNLVKDLLPNKRLLDFGCGAGGFLKLAKSITAEAVGIELETKVGEFWTNKIEIFPNIGSAGGVFDLITSFHVVEHLPHPGKVLQDLSKKLSAGGQIIIETPNSEDALLTLYNCAEFQRFTYWSAHLFLFNANTIKMLAQKSGLEVLAIQHIQRYPLSNHLFWLSKGKPGGHKMWEFLDSPSLRETYAQSLASLGKTDTLVAYLIKSK